MHPDSSTIGSSQSPLFAWNGPGNTLGYLARRNSGIDTEWLGFVPAAGPQPRAILPRHSSSLLSETPGPNLRARLVDVFGAGRKRVVTSWDALVHRGRRESDAVLKAGMGTSTFYLCPPLDISAPLDLQNAGFTISSMPPTETPATRDQIKERLRAKLGTMQCQSGLAVELRAKEGPRSSSPEYINDLPALRFSDIATAAATAVMAPDGMKMLAANRITLAGREIAIASQYPRRPDIGAYLGMLAQERPSVLVVLASSLDIRWYGLPRYFSNIGTYGDISVSLGKLDDDVVEEGVRVRRHEITISRPGQEDVTVPVLHASEWEDRSSLTVAQLQALARMIRDQTVRPGDDATAPGGHGVPVIHCHAGVGRTGQIIATLARDHAPAMPLETVVTEMRVQRNACMVHTDAQLDMLVDMWLDDGQDVFAADVPVATGPADVPVATGLLRISPSAGMPIAKQE